MAHNLGLEAIGQNVLDVMPDQIPGNGIDAVFGFQDVTGGAVFLFDRQQLFFAAVTEQVLEGPIKGVLFIQGVIGGCALVENLHRSPVIHRIQQAI